MAFFMIAGSSDGGTEIFLSRAVAGDAMHTTKRDMDNPTARSIGTLRPDFISNLLSVNNLLGDV
jgi:hypothetical protein